MPDESYAAEINYAAAKRWRAPAPEVNGRRERKNRFVAGGSGQLTARPPRQPDVSDPAFRNISPSIGWLAAYRRESAKRWWKVMNLILVGNRLHDALNAKAAVFAVKEGLKRWALICRHDFRASPTPLAVRFPARRPKPL